MKNINSSHLWKYFGISRIHQDWGLAAKKGHYYQKLLNLLQHEDSVHCQPMTPGEKCKLLSDIQTFPMFPILKLWSKKGIIFFAKSEIHWEEPGSVTKYRFHVLTGGTVFVFVLFLVVACFAFCQFYVSFNLLSVGFFSQFSFLWKECLNFLFLTLKMSFKAGGTNKESGWEQSSWGWNGNDKFKLNSCAGSYLLSLERPMSHLGFRITINAFSNRGGHFKWYLSW